jgi:hypothetical protein
MEGSSPTRACEFADDVLLVRPHGFGPALFQPYPLPGLGAPSLRRRRPEGMDARHASVHLAHQNATPPATFRSCHTDELAAVGKNSTLCRLTQLCVVSIAQGTPLQAPQQAISAPAQRRP